MADPETQRDGRGEQFLPRPEQRPAGWHLVCTGTSPDQDEAEWYEDESHIAENLEDGCLDFTGTSINDEWFLWLLPQLSRAPRIHTLRFFCQDISSIAASALAKSECMSNLHRLEFVRTHIEADGAKALAASSYLSGLHTLNVSENDIGNEGALAIAQSAYLSGIRRLDLADSNISNPEIITVLCKRILTSPSHIDRDDDEPSPWIQVYGNPLRWPHMTVPIAEDVLKETDPRQLLNLLLDLRADSLSNTRGHYSRVKPKKTKTTTDRNLKEAVRQILEGKTDGLSANEIAKDVRIVALIGHAEKSTVRKKLKKWSEGSWQELHVAGKGRRARWVLRK
jgi:hypothetical protein